MCFAIGFGTPWHAAPAPKRQSPFGASSKASGPWGASGHRPLGRGCGTHVGVRARQGASGQRKSPIIQTAVNTHHADLPLDVFDADCDTVANWFRGRLDFTIRPRLSKDAKDAGDCIGGRLVNVGERLGALLVYQTPEGKRIRELVVPSSEATTWTRAGRQVGGQEVFFERQRAPRRRHTGPATVCSTC